MNAVDLSAERLQVAPGTARRWRACAFLAAGAGVVMGILAAVLTPEVDRHLAHRALVSFAFLLSVVLGALGFVMIQHATRAGWSVTLRRVAEVTASTGLTGVLLFLAVPALAGWRSLYPWARPEAAADAVLAAKLTYLNAPFFALRLAGYFLFWKLLAEYFTRLSVRQDRTGEPSLTLRMQRASTWGLAVYALTLTFAAFDLLMSLSPHWYSAIFGVYYFAGGFVGFLASLPIFVRLLQRSGRLTRVVTPEHYHDMGKLIFAFVVFWAYIAFSQYLLIWYANIGEETAWYARRQTGSWLWVSLALLFGHFVAPFLVLLSRHPKRRTGVLTATAAWVLLMHWLDIYWLVMPEASPGRFSLHPLDLACLLAAGGLVLGLIFGRLGRQALIPLRDPRLEEALHFENA